MRFLDRLGMTDRYSFNTQTDRWFFNESLGVVICEKTIDEKIESFIMKIARQKKKRIKSDIQKAMESIEIQIKKYDGQ